MATDAQIGIGSKLEIQRASPNTWVEVKEVKDLELPNGETESLDVTHMGSPNRQREFISGLQDNGSITTSMNWKPGSATDTLLNTLKQSGETFSLRFTIPAPTPANANITFVETFSAHLEGYARTAPVGEARF